MMQAIIDQTGRLISLGTIIADPLPAGLTAVKLTDQQWQDYQSGRFLWDPATRTIIPNPTWIDPAIAEGNKTAIETNLAQDLDAMQTIIGTPNPSIANIAQAQTVARDQARQIKDIARTHRRLIRLAIGRLDGST